MEKRLLRQVRSKRQLGDRFILKPQTPRTAGTYGCARQATETPDGAPRCATAAWHRKAGSASACATNGLTTMNTMLDDKQKAAMDAGVRFGMQMLKPPSCRRATAWRWRPHDGRADRLRGAFDGHLRHRPAEGASSRNNCAAWNPTYRMRGSWNPACNEDAQR